MRSFNKRVPLLWIVLFTSLCAVISVGLMIFTSLKNYQTKNTSLLDSKKCLSIENSQSRQICQADQLDQILLAGNIIGAFDLISDYYQKDLTFKKECHSFSHRIGEKGYEFFSRNKEIKLGDNTSHCGFGFYHGFMEALVQKTNDMAQARELCNYIALQMYQTDKKAEAACYHGIGHGVVDGSDPRSRGDPYKIVEPGIVVCEKLTTNRLFLYQCAGGIFNSLAIMYTNSQNGLQRNQEDPFKVCYKFKGRILDACLSQMNTYVISLADKDLKKAGMYLHQIPKDYNPSHATDSTVSFLAAFKQDPAGYGDIIKECQSFRSGLVNNCIDGYAAGLIEFGPPGKEYEAPLVFCKHQLLTENQQDSCFKRSLQYLDAIYSSNQFEAICEMVDIRHQVYCAS